MPSSGAHSDAAARRRPGVVEHQRGPNPGLVTDDADADAIAGADGAEAEDSGDSEGGDANESTQLATAGDAGTQPDAHRERERRRMVREVSLLFLLALSYLHFYYWQVQLEIAALRSVSVFIPAPEARTQKRSL